MTIPYAAFSAVRFCIYTVRRMQYDRLFFSNTYRASFLLLATPHCRLGEMLIELFANERTLMILTRSWRFLIAPLSSPYNPICRSFRDWNCFSSTSRSARWTLELTRYSVPGRQFVCDAFGFLLTIVLLKHLKFDVFDFITRAFMNMFKFAEVQTGKRTKTKKQTFYIARKK